MEFKDYQKQAIKTLKINGNRPNELLARLALGLSGESGEVAEKVKRWLRGDYSYGYSEFKKQVRKELGDCLWYIAVLAKKLDYHCDLDKIAQENLEKLERRKRLKKILGHGDNR